MQNQTDFLNDSLANLTKTEGVSMTIKQQMWNKISLFDFNFYALAVSKNRTSVAI